MSIVLGDNRYGKAETRLLRVNRSGGTHEIKDVNVSVALSGDFEAVHLRGENAKVLPTDSQKNIVYALAKEAPLGEIEDFALRLGRHFLATSDSVRRAHIHIEEFPWERIQLAAAPHPHAFRRVGTERRLATVICEADEAWAGAGLADLVVLKSTGSEFWGFAKDRYTTLEETRDRILATAVAARWRFATLDVAWAESFLAARQALLETFARHHSLSLQQTLYEMGKAVLESRTEIAEVRLSLPNRHHFPVDLSPFGLSNENELFSVADRPYGLIEGTVRREGIPPAPSGWEWS